MSNSQHGQKVGGITLGERYKDRHSGYEGIAVGVTIYLYGCRHVLLESGQRDKDGKIEALWFEEERLEGVEVTSTKGGPMPHPPARTDR